MFVIIKVYLLEKDTFRFYYGGNVVSFDPMLGGYKMIRYRITDVVDRTVSCEVFVYLQQICDLLNIFLL
jgi:hypothetical protein